MPEKFAGRVIIEWPPSGRAGILLGWHVQITDADTGKPITTVTSLAVLHAEAEGIVWADLTMFADEDGAPVLDGVPPLRDGEVILSAFPFEVAEMRAAAGAGVAAQRP